MKRDRILIIGASGQIGSVLTNALAVLYGEENIKELVKCIEVPV